MVTRRISDPMVLLLKGKPFERYRNILSLAAVEYHILDCYFLLFSEPVKITDCFACFLREGARKS